MHPLAKLAKETIELYVRERKVLALRDADLTPEMKGSAGVFVSLKERSMLRGCIGTFQPTEPNIASEVIRNAISAATQDPRFSPVSSEELERLDYSVDVLTAPEQVNGIADLDPKRYGVIVKAGSRRGLLLPDLEGVDTSEEQVGIAIQKAGIAPGTPVTLFRFEVMRYH